ncbi:MAG: 3-deoxy-manno-octulosonate cytidylyltransferase [Gemmatimonadetes bacterium]|nr:MAG: 3-deoxy-manno-octulosonate cytidylyltransferase [Gemmatimonadota bacterium]
MRTLAVIPARLGATRLPRKPLRLLAGVPLVVRVLERVVALQVADRCIVATDSREILEEVERAGGHALLTDPAHPSGTDRVAEVASRADCRAFEAIVNVQGDEPFVSAAAVRGALGQVTDGGFSLGTAALRAEPEILGRADVVKVVTADDGAAMYFSRAPIPFLRDGADAAARDARVLHHVGVYAYTPDALAQWVALPVHPLERIERLEQLRPLAHGMRMGVALTDDTVRRGIDTEEDLELANSHWATFTTES